MNYLDRKQRLILFDAVSNLHPRLAEECSFTLHAKGRIPYVPDLSDLVRFPGEGAADVGWVPPTAAPDSGTAADYGFPPDSGAAADYGFPPEQTENLPPREEPEGPAVPGNAPKKRDTDVTGCAAFLIFAIVSLVVLLYFLGRPFGRKAEEHTGTSEPDRWDSPVSSEIRTVRREESTDIPVSTAGQEENTRAPQDTEQWIPSDALTGKLGENVKYVFLPREGELRIYGSGEMPDPKIVDGHPEYPFSSGENAFADKVISLVFDEGITYTGFRIGDRLENLEYLTLPTTMKQIDDYAFKGCKKLKWVNFRPRLTVIGREAFCGTALTSVNLPEGLRTVGEMAFADCPDLRAVYVPNTVKQIGTDAFAGVQKIVVAEDNPWYRVEENSLINLKKSSEMGP